jgi:glutaredoxin 3
MAKVEIYTGSYCPYCTRAKELLAIKGVAYVEYDVTDDQDARVTLVERAQGRRTIPQIFINNVSMGGYDDIRLLDDQGKLDALLAEAE